MLTYISNAVSAVLIAAVRLYQVTLSPLFGQRCRFYPSCSRYMIDAIMKKGPIRGPLLGIWRVLRCHPFNPGGYDPVK